MAKLYLTYKDIGKRVRSTRESRLTGIIQRVQGDHTCEVMWDDGVTTSLTVVEKDFVFVSPRK